LGFTQKKSKGFLGQDVLSRLKVSDDCKCRGFGNCDICLEDKNKLSEWMKSDLVDFKDNVGRNKLMVLVGELERGVEFKKSIIRGCVDCLLDKLSGDEYSNLSDLTLFDEKDYEGRRVISHMLTIGMVEELRYFIESVSDKVHYRYDFGITNPSLGDGVSPFCLLANIVRKKGDLTGILEIILKVNPSIMNLAVDGKGNTVYHLCSTYGNSTLFEYLKGLTGYSKELLRVNNKSFLGATALSIKCFENNIFRSMLKEELQNEPKGFKPNLKEYGRELLLIAANSGNDMAMKVLFENGANPKGAIKARVWEKTKTVGKFLVDVVANVGDTSSFYASAYLFGVAYKGNLASTIVGSFRKHFLSNKLVLMTEKDIKFAFKYLDSHYESFHKALKAICEGKYESYKEVLEKVENLSKRLEDYHGHIRKRHPHFFGLQGVKKEKEKEEERRAEFILMGEKIFLDGNFSEENVNKILNSEPSFEELLECGSGLVEIIENSIERAENLLKSHGLDNLVG
tara:strand:+ start:3059 stop:4594 length:1536 start_codon:yes stop_codon:yes gene_type:complete